MGKLKILASGDSPQAQANARGKLFEKIMARVLKHYGYSIDEFNPNVTFTSIEIDIVGKHTVTNIPLYAECKCYETKVDCPKLNGFFGKYMTRWFKNNKCHGLFIALPGVNSAAKGFYEENIASNKEITVHLYEEQEILQTIIGTPEVVDPGSISNFITEEMGKPGDWILLWTDEGIFLIQYIIPPGTGRARALAIFDAMGQPISESSTVDYLKQLYVELNDFDIIEVTHPVSLASKIKKQDVEEIVEVRGSSECFEYQFPASPEHFVGRQSVLDEMDLILTKTINKEISSRGILLLANSGWGKSSVVLATMDRLNKMGHFAAAIDSRAAASSQFILSVIEYTLKKFGNFDGLVDKKVTQTITGFEGATKLLLDVGQKLESNKKLMVIFLDQFENIFFLPEALKRIRDLLFRICDVKTNIILGFSWKTDLVGLTGEFPYRLRDNIVDSSKRIILDTFSEVETNALLDKLQDTLQAPLREDLKFFLAEFSMGYPWLLKKLCAHVKSQLEGGVSQKDIANSLLNIEELFQEDLKGLSPEEEDTLRRISKRAPINVSELREELKPELVQSLVNRRLVVTIGTKLDVYWDIFRDYLNSGSVPIQENYILRTSLGSVLKATKLLAEAKGTLRLSKFKKRAGLSEKSFYNVARDMRLLGLAKVSIDTISLEVNLPKKPEDFEVTCRIHLRDRLQRNRLVKRLMDQLEIDSTLTIEQASRLLMQWCPYISAKKQTWQTYARCFADWMDVADIAIYDRKECTLNHYTPETDVRERRLRFAKRRAGIKMPSIQYTPIEKMAIRLVDRPGKSGITDLTDFKKSTITKTLRALADLDFITFKAHTIKLNFKLFEFVRNPNKRPALFAKAALKMKSFSSFTEILKTYKDRGATLSQLSLEFKNKLDVDLKKSTAETYVKIMLDWARHAGLAPGVFAETTRISKQELQKKAKIQKPLFNFLNNE